MTREQFLALCEEVKDLSLEQLTAKLHQLRSEADNAEAMFLTYCVAVDYSGIWKKFARAGEQTFAAWLSQNHICKESRYVNWRQAVETIPELEVLDVIGVNAGVELGSAPEEKRSELQREMQEQVRQNHGLPMSRQAAQRLKNKVCGFPPSRANREQTRIQTLQAELRKAQARIKELEREVKVLREAGSKAPPKKGKKGNRSRSGPQPSA